MWTPEKARERLTELRFDLNIAHRERQAREAAAALVEQFEGHPLMTSGGGVEGGDLLRATVACTLDALNAPISPEPSLDGGRYVDAHVLVPLTGGFEAQLVVEEQIREQLQAAA